MVRTGNGVGEKTESLERVDAGENETIRQSAILQDRVDIGIRKATLTLGLAFTGYTSLEKQEAV